MISLRQFLRNVDLAWNYVIFVLDKRSDFTMENMTVHDWATIAADKGMDGLRTFFALNFECVFQTASSKANQRRRKRRQRYSVLNIVSADRILTMMESMIKHGYAFTTMKTKLCGLIAVLQFLLRQINLRASTRIENAIGASQIMAIKDQINDYMRRIAPEVKVATIRNVDEDVLRQRNRYIDSKTFAAMAKHGLKLLREWTVFLQTHGKEYVESNRQLYNRAETTKLQYNKLQHGIKLYQDYMDLLVFCCFVSIPGQRRQVFQDLRMDQIKKEDDHYVIKLHKEKNTWVKIKKRKAVIERIVPLPTFLTSALDFWMSTARRDLASLLGYNLEPQHKFIISRSPTMTSGNFSNRFQKVAKALTGLRLSPLNVRKLRATFYIRDILKNAITDVQRDKAIEDYAEVVGNSRETLLKSYFLRSDRQRNEAAYRVVQQANEMMGLTNPN